MLRIKLKNHYYKYKWIFVPNNRNPKYMKQTLTELKGEIEFYAIIVGHFSLALTIMDSTSNKISIWT